MIRRVAVLLLVAVVSLAPAASADERVYSGYVDCGVDPTGGVTDSEGGCPTQLPCDAGLGCVRFDADHLRPPDPLLDAVTLTIDDDVFGAVGGWVCQDNDGDLDCGGASDFGALFCRQIDVYAGLGWDPFTDTYVFIGGPLVTLAACNDLGYGTSGTVQH